MLGDQVAAVVRGAPRQAIRTSALTQVFTRYYGYSLKPNHYGSETLEDLIRKLRNHVKVGFCYFYKILKCSLNDESDISLAKVLFFNDFFVIAGLLR